MSLAMGGKKEGSKLALLASLRGKKGKGRIASCANGRGFASWKTGEGF